MPTMADVAKRAGVALSTVSHTLSGKRPISAEVRQRVLQAIDELGYQPHALARAGYQADQDDCLAVSGTFKRDIRTAPGICGGGFAGHQSQEVWSTVVDCPNEDQEELQMIQQGFVDGLVLMEVKLDDPRVRMLKEQNYPFTMIGHGAENEGINFVDLDFDYALHACVEYLAGLGHKHLAFINNSSELFDLGLGYVVRSENAFRHALAQCGLEGLSSFCKSNAQAGYEATEALLMRNPATTAIIVLNAWVNGGIIRAIYDRGLKIPADISLIGILSPRMAEMTVPPLTNIDFPYSTMGYMGAELFICQLEGATLSVQELLKPPLTIRQSSGPCL